MIGLDRVRELGARESGLAVVFTTRADGTASGSVVNAGVLEHPVTGEPVVGFVARGEVRKLANVRMRPGVSLVFRSGWEWVAVEGEAEVAGDPRLLRDVYAAAVGGTSEEWAALDDVMVAERHAAVLVRPTRVYSNPVRELS
ncbi:MAG: pyridoxamine 5'-phosphate oxidase [Acidimicrobiia bacterium]